MRQSTNYKANLPEGNNVIDISVLNKNITDIIDKGLILDVGDSTGNANNYVLNLGSITLSSANKGISFKFWADKNSTGAVKINGTYNLVKASGSSVTNLKAGAPYTITYDGGTNFFLASGGGTDDVNFSASDLLTGKTANNSNGEKVNGTMPNKGAVTASLNCGGSYTIPAGYHNGSGKVTANSLSSQTSANATAGDILKDKTAWVNGSKLTGTIDNKGAITAGNSIVQSGDKLYCRMPRGAYLTNASSGYPEISYPQGDVAAALGLTANKIVAGNTIGGIAGTATVGTMAKYVEADLSAVNVYTNADGTEEFKITTGFKPRFAMVNYFHSEYNKTILVLFNYAENKWYGIGRKYNHSSTTTYDTSHVITVVSFENDGVIVKASPYYRSKVSWIISQ